MASPEEAAQPVALKTEAKLAVRKATDVVEKSLMDARRQMRTVAADIKASYQKASRRLKKNNIDMEVVREPLDALRKYKKMDQQYKHMQEIIVNLGQLAIIIQVDEIKPDGYKEKIKGIIEEPCPKMDEVSDEQLLEELQGGDFDDK